MYSTDIYDLSLSRQRTDIPRRSLFWLMDRGRPGHLLRYHSGIRMVKLKYLENACQDGRQRGSNRLPLYCQSEVRDITNWTTETGVYKI